MVTQSDCQKNTAFISETDQHDLKNDQWSGIIPIPNLLLPWSSWIIFTIAVLCFVNSMYGEFVFDDSEAVINNNDLKPETPFMNIFKNDFWGTKLTHNASHKSYRPFTVLTFRLNYFVTGLQPYSFHLVNVILHGFVSILVYKVISAILNEVLNDDGAPEAAFTCALLFAVHPVHTESVSAVVGRADLLCGIFFFSSFLAYVHASNTSGPNAIPSQLSLRWMAVSLLLAGLSMLCKEQGITVIGVCSIFDIVIISKLDLYDILQHMLGYKNIHTSSSSSLLTNKLLVFKWVSMSRLRELLMNGTIQFTSFCLGVADVSYKRCIASLIIRQLIMAAGGSVLLACRWYVMGASTPVFQQVDNPASFEENVFVRAVNYHYIYAMNVWLLFHPLWLCFDWSMGCIPLIRGICDVRLFAVLLFWLFFGRLLYCSIFHPEKKIRRLLCVSLAFILVPFLPASNLFFRVGFVVAERVLYLPSVGFCLLVVIGVWHLSHLINQHHQLILQGSLVLLIVIFAARCIQRSRDWNTEETLFRSGLKVCPLNAKVHYNIAKNAADNGDREVAIKEYREAIRLNPLYDQAMNNLANILKDQGQLLEAEQLLLSAIKIRSDFAAAWMNLGIVQSSLKKTVEAEKSYHMAIQCRRKYPDCYYNLGNLYLDKKHYDDAYRAWRNATALQPTHLVAWNNMIIMLDSIGDLRKAESVAREALQHLPTEASLHFNLANTLGKAGKYVESEIHFLQAIRLNASNPTYHTNLGVLYHRWKKYAAAEQSYKQALKLKADMKSAQDNLRLLYKSMGRV